MMGFTDEEVVRYSRHIILPEVGGKGQKRLKSARVLVVGAGGLGSPAAYYLAAAGVGTLGILDSDVVDLSNLQRQILHRTAEVGSPKIESAAKTLTELNPGIEVIPLHHRIGPENVESVIRGYDLVVDAVDNFDTRYILNDACVSNGIPMVEGGVLRWDGLCMTVLPGKGPCYRCAFPSPPPENAVPSCAQAGVMGAVAGVVGTLQAVEAIKLILGAGELLVGRMLFYEGLSARFREVSLDRDPACPACGSVSHGS